MRKNGGGRESSFAKIELSSAFDESIAAQIKERRKMFEGLWDECDGFITNAAEGQLHLCRRRGYEQFYQYKDVAEGEATAKKEIYIKKCNEGLIRNLSQKLYCSKMKKVLEKQLCSIDQFLKAYDPISIWDCAKGIPEGILRNVRPMVLTDSEFRELWEAEEYVGKEFSEDAPEFYSEKGERVRSKSEKLIADKLLLLDIPYKYEKPLYLKGYGIVYPDFTMFNVQTREDVYLEHLGKLDDPDYIEKALMKVRTYERNGYFIGDRLILTGETQKHPLDMRTFEEKVRKVLGMELH